VGWGKSGGPAGKPGRRAGSAGARPWSGRESGETTKWCSRTWSTGARLTATSQGPPLAAAPQKTTLALAPPAASDTLPPSHPSSCPKLHHVGGARSRRGPRPRFGPHRPPSLFQVRDHGLLRLSARARPLPRRLRGRERRRACSRGALSRPGLRRVSPGRGAGRNEERSAEARCPAV
jgi:hypothetical protein